MFAPRMRRAIVTAACTGLLTAGSIVIAAPAFADSSMTWYGTWPNRLAEASFKSYDEVFTVKDHEPDGMSVRVHWLYAGSSIVRGSCTNSKGNGTTKKCDFNIPEDRGIRWCLERVDFDGSEGHGKGAVWTYKCTSDTT